MDQVHSQETSPIRKATDEAILAYLRKCEEAGRSTRTLYTYRKALQRLCDYLGDERAVNENTLEGWMAYMEKTGGTEKEIKSFRPVIQSFLEHVGIRKEKEHAPLSPLTREEYLLILQTAKMMGRHRTYLIIKAMADAGVRQEELQQLTVEMLREGSAWMTRRNRKHLVFFPEPLRSELLEYAAHEKIQTGLIFVSKHGPMGHSHIWKEVKQVCRQAGVAEGKGTPSSLYKLYQATVYRVCHEDASHAKEHFLELLEEEEKQICWNEPDETE